MKSITPKDYFLRLFHSSQSIFRSVEADPRSLESDSSRLFFFVSKFNISRAVLLVQMVSERGDSATLYFLHLFLLQLATQDARGKEQKEVPMVLLGNKGDMVHLRQVSSEEGDTIILV